MAPREKMLDAPQTFGWGSTWSLAGLQRVEQTTSVPDETAKTVLRRENYPQPYEALKELTRGKAGITRESIHSFIDGLKITVAVKKELKRITPHNYTGVEPIYGSPK